MMYRVAADNSVELRCCLLKGRSAHSEHDWAEAAGLCSFLVGVEPASLLSLWANLEMIFLGSF